MSDRTADELQAALDLIHEKGWHQGSWAGRDGSICSYKAMLDVSGVTAAATSYWAFIRHNSLPVGVGRWNDNPHTTLEDVELAFKKAIEAERNLK